jgi:hypothetical protein
MQIGVFIVGVLCLILLLSTILLAHSYYERGLCISDLKKENKNIIESNKMYINTVNKKEKEMKQEIISYKSKIMDFAVLNANFADHIEEYYSKGVFYDKENNTMVTFDNLERIGDL